MHIDIGLPRVNADRQHGGGEALDRQKRTERLLNSRSERLGIYRPAVDKIELHCAAAARRLRQRNEARYADAVKVVFHRHHRLGNIAPIYGINGAVQVAVARGAELFRTVYKHLDGNLRMRKRQLSRSGRAGGSFAAVALEKLPARRGIEKQVLHQHRRAVRAADLAELALPVADFKKIARIRTALTRDNL